MSSIIIIEKIKSALLKFAPEKNKNFTGFSDGETEKNKNLAIFLLLFFTLTLPMLIETAFFDRSSLNAIVFSQGNDLFMDHFNSVLHFGGGDPYNTRLAPTSFSVYPPLCYVIYGVFYLLSPVALGDGIVYGRDLLNEQRDFTYFCLFFGLIIFFIALICFNSIRANVCIRLMFAISVVIAAPFIFTYERGNLILLALLFSLVFVRFYRHEKRAVRVFTYFCLGFAAGLKLYPALLGLLLLREKRWKACFVCASFGVILIFAPFLLFGGVGAVRALVLNMQELFPILNAGYIYKLGAVNSVEYLLNGINYAFGFDFISETALKTISCAVGYTLIGLCGVGIFAHSGWKRIACVALVMIIYSDSSFIYTGIFMLLPLTEFLRDGEKGGFTDYFYAVAFALFFAPLKIFGHYFIGNYHTLSGTVERYIILVFALVISVEGIIIIVRAAREKIKDKKEISFISDQS